MRGKTRTAALFLLLAGGCVSSTPEKAAEPATQTFSASADFSDKQGEKGWSYLDSAGESLTYRPPSNDYPSDAWQGAEKYVIITRDGGHPGNDRDAIRRWTAPLGGRVRIRGNAHDADTACGELASVAIAKGERLLWQSSVPNGDTRGTNFDLTAGVQKGDTIDFVMNRGDDRSNMCDMTFFSPTIELTPLAER